MIMRRGDRALMLMLTFIAHFRVDKVKNIFIILKKCDFSRENTFFMCQFVDAKVGSFIVLTHWICLWCDTLTRSLMANKCKMWPSRKKIYSKNLTFSRSVAAATHAAIKIQLHKNLCICIFGTHYFNILTNLCRASRQTSRNGGLKS